MALALPGAIELPHFERASFRVNKRIFATLDEKKKIAVLMFSPIEQSVFCAFDKTVIYPVDNKWGKQGWTLIDLKKVRKDMLKDILTTSYNTVAAPKK